MTAGAAARPLFALALLLAAPGCGSTTDMFHTMGAEPPLCAKHAQGRKTAVFWSAPWRHDRIEQHGDPFACTKEAIFIRNGPEGLYSRMNEADLEQIRQRLLDLRAELQELEEASREETPPEGLNQADTCRLSRRDAMQAQIAAEEGARQRKRQLQKIDGALRRIQLGEYGTCFICEAAIEPSRLSADPTTTRCMNCMEE